MGRQAHSPSGPAPTSAWHHTCCPLRARFPALIISTPPPGPLCSYTIELFLLLNVQAIKAICLPKVLSFSVTPPPSALLCSGVWPLSPSPACLGVLHHMLLSPLWALPGSVLGFPGLVASLPSKGRTWWGHRPFSPISSHFPFPVCWPRVSIRHP